MSEKKKKKKNLRACLAAERQMVVGKCSYFFNEVYLDEQQLLISHNFNGQNTQMNAWEQKRDRTRVQSFCFVSYHIMFTIIINLMFLFIYFVCGGLWFRFPFLLVDRVIEYNPGVSAVAIKNVTINDNFFPGHFPERPIMPGVLMVEVNACSHTLLTFVL